MREEQFWWVSELNGKPEVMGRTHFPERLKFYDTTLRDGEQTIGVSFTKEEKLQIARVLDELGVDRIEAGMPVVSQEDREAVELIVNAGLEAEIWGFCRAVRGDIDACIDAGVKHIICESASSRYKMEAYGLTPEDILGRALENLLYAKSRGLYAAFYAGDATRADLGFLEALYKKAVEEGKADEVVLVDTLGVATPETTFYLTERVRQWVQVPIMIHCHNDFGLATACTISSVKGGADCVHVTLNGLGEKTGNADMAETAIAAKLYGISMNINFKKLYPAAKLVETLSSIPLSPLKPVVGENVFKRESGVTVAQLISFPPAVEGYSPELIGREREVLLSKKSGRRSVEYKLEQLGLEATADQVVAILKKVKELGVKKRGLVSDDEFRGIVEELL
jgi:isopropylmalate/homocitrate/citramalate synthase